VTTIRWTEPASTDFLGIVEWLQARNPAAAAKVGRSILDAVELLKEHPYAGKPGRSPDTRELGVTRYPYLIVYSVEAGPPLSEGHQIAVLRVLHDAMLWPPEDQRTD
jgi:plasmid stabilization system protein ParE